MAEDEANEVVQITDNESLIRDFKKFEKASYKKFKSLFDQIKKDRTFIAGSQNDSTDETLIGTDVPKCNLNVTQNAIRTIVNTYLPNTFKWSYQNNPQLQELSDAFMGDVDNSTATVEALTSAVGAALGVLVFSSDYDIDGSEKPILYSVPDVTNVRLDPNANKLNFADARKGAIVELKSKEALRAEYGDLPIFSEHYEKPLIDISEDYDRKLYLPLVTYFVKNDDFQGVTCYKLLGDRLIEQPISLPYSYIPIVPVFGESCWTKDNKQSWTGITTQMRAIQRLVNYSYRQLILRCSKSPKNTWLAESEAIENNEMYYKNSDKTLNPLLIYNKWSKDGKRQLEAPTRLPNNIEFTDVDQLMQNALGLINSIIGIPSVGLETDVEKTATEVLVNDKVFNNNVRSYLYHLKYSMALIGVLFADYQYQQPMYGKIRVSVIEGPEEAMKKQEARVLFQQYAPLITADEDKRKLLIAQCRIEDDNQYVKFLLDSLQPVPTANELQQQELLGQADTTIKQLNNQIAQLQARVHELETDQKISAYSLDREMTKAKLDHQFKMEEITLQARLKGDDPAVEAVKAETEIEKAQIGLEKEYVGLQKAQTQALKSEEPKAPVEEA
jgi:hypothetical protein